MPSRPVDLGTVRKLVSGGSVGDRIASLRKERGWSKSDLARELWPDTEKPRYRHVQKWEVEGDIPDTRSLQRLAEVFAVTIEELLGVAAGQEPPFAAWREFVASERGRAMTPQQRRTLAGIWWGDLEPTVEAYEALLLGLRLAARKPPGDPDDPG